MAERYQDRQFPSGGYARGGDQHEKPENDPLAELARLIGQTDPFAAQGRPTVRPPAAPAQSYHEDDYRQHDDQQDHAEQAPPPPGPPSWMRRANVQPAPAPEPDYPVSVSPVHPLHRYPAKPAVPEPDPHQPQAYQDRSYQAQAYQDQADQQHGQAYQDQAYQEPYAQPDASRYDDALYGRLETGEQDYQRDPAYPDDPYAFQNDYPDDAELEEPKKQRGGMMTVAVILALAVVGTGAAFAYKTYIGSPRSGEPPVIKADNTPTKIVPATTDSSAKVPDRMVSDGTEKIVPREEAPVDVNAKVGGPRVVFPPLNQNANPPSVASVSPSAVPSPSTGPIPSNGTLSSNSPRPIRTVTVKGDQTDSTTPQSAVAVPKPVAAPAAPRNPPTSAHASANQPLSLAPQPGSSAEPPQRMAATNPTQLAPTSSGGGYIVQVSSQQSEDSAAASYRVLQSKYGSVLGGRSPVIKRVDLTDKGKGIVYRAFAGPYASAEEATQACNSLKSAGLSACFVQRN
ncbi:MULTISPECIES: SPOR domain-containing protein [unclassified Bradyrhizobium]|uniref:SPOR domain-containing protein n=1 Tax=unclassified Bradyrhizobium TaxID=2631580 RepID=UPI0035147C5C